MKIGIYTPYLDTLTGGERYMLTIASCLSTNNIVEVLWDDKEIVKKAEDKLGIDLKKARVVPNFFTASVSLIDRLKKTREYDLIIFLSDGSIPIVMSKNFIIHFQHPVEWVTPGLWTKIKMRKVTVISNSYFTKKYIDRTFGIKSKVLYPPVETSNYNITKKENIILTVGRYVLLSNGQDFKKLSFLIDAFDDFRKKVKDLWRFVIITSYLPSEKENYEKLKKHAEDLPVEIYSSIPFSKVKDYYSRAKIYWHAAGYGENIPHYPERAEHFGISTVEAMAASCVPIVFNGGGQREIVQDGVNGYLWNTKEELLQKTKEITEEKNMHEKIKKQTAQSIKRFDRDKFCSELQEIINHL